jgi:hypothetical protein
LDEFFSFFWVRFVLSRLDLWRPRDCGVDAGTRPVPVYVICVLKRGGDRSTRRVKTYQLAIIAMPMRLVGIVHARGDGCAAGISTDLLGRSRRCYVALS